MTNQYMFTASTRFGTRLRFCTTVSTTGKLPRDRSHDSVALFQNSRCDSICFVIKLGALLFFFLSKNDEKIVLLSWLW
jgi:hypothetical protein